MFSIARLPRIEFGAGCLDKLPNLIGQYGARFLLVTGARSFIESDAWERLRNTLSRDGLAWDHATVDGEPSPGLVDGVVRRYAGAGHDVVVGIGGGSALDAAKAVAGLLRVGNTVMDYLEGVGPEAPYPGPALPFIAVPTTAGTGSEATKNAVLSEHGKHGFKKSFRDERLVAEYAVVDPDLLGSCPRLVIAANGMDALTQLIESYVSIRANPFTDALCISGLRAARDGLLPFYEHNTAEARENMAYASLISGICLAQTGLGSVHGLASPLGAFYPIPHGVVCGTLVAAATRVNVEALSLREPANPALQRYARVAEVLSQQRHAAADRARAQLIDLLEEWTRRLGLPRLGEYGVRQSEFDKVVANSRGSSMRTNPIVLQDEEIRSIIEARL